MSRQILGEPKEEIRLLIVDDDKAIAGILRELLGKEGRLVDVCHDGLSAVRRIQEKSYDLIMVDLVMPGVGGLDVLRYAKKANPDVIVIIITGYASVETAISAIKEGAYDYIRKPCKLEEIKIVVENATERIRLNRENRELMTSLQDAYHELMELKKKKEGKDKVASINFFSSSMPSLHYLYKKDTPSGNYVSQLEALSSLKKSGSLDESEFKAFKRHLLEMIAQGK